MKDQKKLLNKCLSDKVPAFILQGRDVCSVEILNSACGIYKKNGCSDEFLYDFQELIRDFSEYQNENQSEIRLSGTNELGISESDKKKLLNDCLYNEIPVIVFQGTDACAIDILKSANEIYRSVGYNEGFQYDFQNLINGFSGYQHENQLKIKLPSLNEVDKELIHRNMVQKELNIILREAITNNDFKMISQLKDQGCIPSLKVINDLRASIPVQTMIVVEKIFGIRNALSGNMGIPQADLSRGHMKQDLQPDMI